MIFKRLEQGGSAWPAYASVRAGVTPIEPWGISSFVVHGGSQSFRIGPSKTPERSLEPHRDTLVGLLKLVVDRGTGPAAALDGFAAGKTGTSQDYRGVWFIGFNEDLTVGIWVGNDNGEPMNGVTAGELPAMMWKDFMESGAIAMSPAALETTENAPSSGNQNIDTNTSSETAITNGMQCNVRECSRNYRSFQASDRTYQPYRGQRRLCEK